MRNKLLFSSVLLAASVSLSAQKSATITLHADQGTQVIPKEIYGQFAEHLGTIACKIVQNRRVMGFIHMNLHKKVEFSIFLFFNSTM